MQHDIVTDDHGPLGAAMADAVSTCVHCGFCLAACPTYRELGRETDSPRGRIVLMKEVLEGSLSVEEAFPHLDPCLGCLACEPACPSGVAYRDLISPFRAVKEPSRRRPWQERLRRMLIQGTLPYPGRMRIAARMGRFAKPLRRLLPKSLAMMLDLLPHRLPPRAAWPSIVPAVGRRRGRVALLLGCAQQVLDPDINTATIDVLTRNGVEVLIPQGQTCCGALSWHGGNLSQARRFAQQNLKEFPEDVDAVVTNAAGCGSGMQEYHLILKGTPSEERADRFRHRVCDVALFLENLGDLEPIPDSGKELCIAYHDACHLANAQGVRKEPRMLLRRIPGVQLVEIPNSHLCCGSAGIYNLDQPKVAGSLGAQKVRDIFQVEPDLIASGNIGCLTQLNAHLAIQRRVLPLRHTIQVVRDAYLETDLTNPTLERYQKSNLRHDA